MVLPDLFFHYQCLPFVATITDRLQFTSCDRFSFFEGFKESCCPGSRHQPSFADFKAPPFSVNLLITCAAAVLCDAVVILNESCNNGILCTYLSPLTHANKSTLPLEICCRVPRLIKYVGLFRGWWLVENETFDGLDWKHRPTPHRHSSSLLLVLQKKPKITQHHLIYQSFKLRAEEKHALQSNPVLIWYQGGVERISKVCLYGCLVCCNQTKETSRHELQRDNYKSIPSRVFARGITTQAMLLYLYIICQCNAMLTQTLNLRGPVQFPSKISGTWDVILLYAKLELVTWSKYSMHV